MQNKKIIITLVALLIVCGTLVAQNRTFSPYSRYGIGDIQGTQVGRGRQMGGTGIAQQSRFGLNDLNPAGIAGMDSMTFIFEGAISYFNQEISSERGSATFGNGNFDLFAFGFPLSKWAYTSIGLKPYSAVGYNVANVEVEGTSSDAIQTQAKGNGVISKGFVTLGFKPYKNVAVGVNFGYLFGTLQHNSFTNFPNNTAADSYGSTRKIIVNDFRIDFGAQYKYNINQQKRFIFGLTLAPQSNLDGELKSLLTKGGAIDYDGNVVGGDTLENKTLKLQENNYKLPLQIGLGATYEVVDKISTSIDYTFSNWSQTPFGEAITQVSNSHTIAVGAEWVPNDFKTDAIFYRIRYRGGAYYKKEYLVVNNVQIANYGVTAGVGIPLRRSKNFINLGFNWGKRGTLKSGLILENYYGISIDFVMQEAWFSKRKFE